MVIAGNGDLAKARETLCAELGPDALVDAAAVVASFNAVVRIRRCQRHPHRGSSNGRRWPGSSPSSAGTLLRRKGLAEPGEGASGYS